MNIYKVYSTDDYGRPEDILGYVKADNKLDARALMAQKFNNDEIVKISIVLPDTSVAHSDSTIDNFPSEMYHAVVLYAAGQLIHNKMATMNSSLPTDLDADTTAFDAITDLSTSLSISVTFTLSTSFVGGDLNSLKYSFTISTINLFASFSKNFDSRMSAICCKNALSVNKHVSIFI